MARVVKDYMKEPVRLTFGSTRSRHAAFGCRPSKCPSDRKMEVLQRLIAKERADAGFRAYQARNRSDRREP